MAVRSLKLPWKKRQLERLEKKAMKDFEKELKDTAEKQREVYAELLLRADNLRWGWLFIQVYFVLVLSVPSTLV